MELPLDFKLTKILVLSFNNLADIAGSAIVSFSLLRMKELMSLVAFFMDGVLVEGEEIMERDLTTIIVGF